MWTKFKMVHFFFLEKFTLLIEKIKKNLLINFEFYLLWLNLLPLLSPIIFYYYKKNVTKKNYG